MSYTFIDLFCGCGGLTAGFRRAGWKPLCGVDNSSVAMQTYLKNHGDIATGIVGSISDTNTRNTIINKYKGRVHAVIGGPPCQAFSSANQFKYDSDERLTLPIVYLELAVALKPEFIVMEEVPSAKVYANEWISVLKLHGYVTKWSILNAEHYGVPQSRRRFVLLARKGSEAAHNFPPVRINARLYTAGEAIKQCDARHAEYIYGVTLDKVRKRARMTSKEIQKIGYRPAFAYVPMDMNAPAPTITSGFMGASNGRYAVKCRNGAYRCLTLAEGAIFQSFDTSYIFCGTMTQKRIQIANAVPPKLAEAIAKSLML